MARRKSAEQYNPMVALLVARSFREQAEEQLARIPRPGSAEKLADGSLDVGRTVLLATNLIFAAEIYLKLLIAMDGKRIPNFHELWPLYRVISSRNQSVITEYYSYEISQVPETERTELYFILSTKDSKEVEALKPKMASWSKPGHLKDTLKIAGDAYQTWRYLAEATVCPDKDLVLSLPNVHLRCFCQAAERIITKDRRRRSSVSRSVPA